MIDDKSVVIVVVDYISLLMDIHFASRMKALAAGVAVVVVVVFVDNKYFVFWTHYNDDDDCYLS